jgi:CheY-like chemotaxis protein
VQSIQAVACASRPRLTASFLGLFSSGNVLHDGMGRMVWTVAIAGQLLHVSGFNQHMHQDTQEPVTRQHEPGESTSGSQADGQQRSLSILVVDDEQLIADTLVRILSLSGFSATAAYSGSAALEIAPTLCPDIVLTDVRMPGLNGIETGVRIREKCPETRVILFSGQASVGDARGETAEQGHDFELWRKPIHPRELVRRLSEL